MYDELIAELRRHHCNAKEDDTQEVCDECAYDVIIADKSVPAGIASVCVCGLMNRAADAIEFLQTYKTCFDNIVRIGGWWLVGQDKNLYRMDVPMNWPPKGTKTVSLFPLPEPPKEET